MTYAYDNVEVCLTGRVAEKIIPAAGRAAERVDQLVEVKPINDEDGSWTKFVRMTDLYEIKHTGEE